MRRVVLLGPVPCVGCRRFVAWANGAWHNAKPLRQQTSVSRLGRIHRCPALVHIVHGKLVEKALAA